MWFRMNSNSPGQFALVGHGLATSNGWSSRLVISGPGPASIVFGGSNAQPSLSITGTTMLLPNQWHQLTLTYDGEQGSIYLNSARLAQGSMPMKNDEGAVY